MKPLAECPICGGELVEKQVEKLLRGGVHTAVIRVAAEVCLHCGERLYSVDTIQRFEHIRAQLENGQTLDFEPVGQAFEVGR